MDDSDDNVVPIKPPPGGHKKRPGGRTPEGKGKGFVPKPANGPGWGGPAKGADPDRKEKSYIAGAPPGGHPRNPKRFEAELVAQEALEEMVQIMRNSEYEGTRLMAAEKVRNQIIGTPISRTIVDRQPIEQNVIDPRLMTTEQRGVMRDVLKLAAKKEG